MRLTIEECRKMVASGEELLFVYHIREDRLFFSEEASRVFGWKREVRGYWKESDNWNYVSQQCQEGLVNMIRHELLSVDSVQERVVIEKGPGAGEYLVELSAVWADRSVWDMEAVKGSLKRAGTDQADGGK